MASERNMPTLTLFTPTYNREHLLGRLYRSLCEQDCQDFVWTVVDDGSTDGTEELIRGFQAEDKVDIDYYRKENGGKHTAYNLCLDHLHTELVMIAVDSDDLLTPDAVSSVLRTWDTIRGYTEIQGMVFLCQGIDGTPLVTTYNDEALAKDPSLHDARANGWFYGEAEYIFRSEYVKKFPYPGHPGESFFNEAYTYVQMTGRMRWVKKCIYLADYQVGGLSDSFLRNVIKSPLNYADYSNTMAKWGKQGLTALKYTTYYDAFSLYGGAHGFLRRASHPVAACLLLPAGWIASLGLRLKSKGTEASHG